MKHTWKKAAAFVLATALVAGVVPANVGAGGLFGGIGIVASAADVTWDSWESYDDNDTETIDGNLTVQGNSYICDNAVVVVNGNLTLKKAEPDPWDDGGMDTTSLVVYYGSPVLVVNGDINLEAETNLFAYSGGKVFYTGSIQSNGYYDDDVYKTNLKNISFTRVSNGTSYYSSSGAKYLINGSAFVPAVPVTLNTNGGTINSGNVTLYAEGVQTTLPTNVTKDGCKFLGWYDNEDLEGSPVTAIPADATGDQNYYAKWEVLPVPGFSRASVTLADDLALNFYVDDIADDTAAAEYTVNFTGACVDESSALTYNATEGKYYATTHVYAKDIDKDITATLCKGGDTVDTIEDYSITQYLSSPAFSEADEKTTALINATTNFGYASAEYFYDDDYGVTATFADYNPDVSAYATTFGSDDALLSLVLDSKTAARLYVKGDTTGTESNFSSTKADYPTYHEVTGLLPQNLADEQTITVGTTDYKFSALSWCYRVLSSTSANQKNLNMAKAIMAYYTAAKNYTTVDVASVTITNAPTDAITVGNTGTLTATVSPENATNKTVTWAVTEGTDVLSIDSATGAYEALKAGTAKVTATAGGKTTTCDITVNEASVPATGITLNKTTLSFSTLTGSLAGETTETLVPSLTPTNTTENLTYTWESSNSDVATVDENGNVTGISAGAATITVKATGVNGELTASCAVSVNRIATPGRKATNYLTVTGATAENPVYFTGTYTGSVTSETVAYSHSSSGSYDLLYFNGAQIYKGNWNVGSALLITGGSGTQSDPYVITRV